MWFKTVHFLGLLSTVLVLCAAMAHLMELPNKLKLPREQYLVVQQIYQGWALLGIAVVIALFSTLALTIMAYRRGTGYALPFVALTCIIVTQVIFWVYTAPANKVTNNWMELPINWSGIRNQWEYSHAVNAILYLIAFISLILSALQKEERIVGA